MVEMRDVRFAYAASGFALHVPHLAIQQAEHAACIGPSGCGKTTLINLIAGILLPHEGQVCVAGEVISSLGDAARRARRIQRIGMVFQELELLEYLTAMENILLAYHVSSAVRLTSEARQRAQALAESCGIAHLLARRPRRLSQGERQRVAICRALVTGPQLVMCDEPTGNLDPASTDAAMTLLLEQCQAAGATLLVVTHNHALLDRFERVIDMGELVHDGAGAVGA